MYDVGRQPCQDYRPTMEANEHAQWANVHECVFCRDGATVSFCENCNRDHHEGGYQTCKRSAKGDTGFYGE